MVVATAPVTRSRVDPRLVLSLFAVYVIWSSTYLAMQVAVAELPPFLMASLRFSAAGLVMLLVGIVRGSPLPTRRDWLRALPVGVLLFVGGNGLVAIALKAHAASSGGAAVVCAMMPLWMGVLGVATGERPTRREWGSLLLGFAGVVVLMGGPSLAHDPLHVALLLASPLCWAMGALLSRRLPATPASGDTVMMSALQMIVGGAAMAAVAGVLGERIPAHVSAKSWIAVGYLWLAGSVIGFTAFSWLNKHARPVVATSYAYVNPILAVLMGAALSGESLGPSTLVANVLIVGAVMLALRVWPAAAPRSASRRPAA